MMTAKDPVRSRQGRINKAAGQLFEDRISQSFEWYRGLGLAKVDKTPEPMKPIKRLPDGKYIAIYEKKAQPDYKGLIRGGRTVIFEAKFTSSPKMEQSRVNQTQTNYMNDAQAMGARCYVIAGFFKGGVYRIPWGVWADMKQHFGRKYVTERDLQPYRVGLAKNGALLLLKTTKGENNL